MKKYFKNLLCLLFLLIVVTGCGCSNKKQEEETKATDDVILEDTKKMELDIIDFAILFDENISTIYFEVENNTDSLISYEKIVCSVYDESDKLLFTFEKPFGSLESLTSKEFKIMVDINLTDVKNVEYDFE